VVAENRNATPELLEKIVDKTTDKYTLRVVAENRNATPELKEKVEQKLAALA
jgi:hypothetical protein